MKLYKSYIKVLAIETAFIEGQNCIKSLLVPHILQLASVTVLSENVIADFEIFLWNENHLVLKSTLIQLHEWAA